MADRFDEMATFVEVARRESFIQAATHLGRNVSAVSLSIAALETRLGVRLLQRTTRRVALSEAGRAYFARCQALLAEIDGADAAAQELGSTPRGMLRISAASGFGLSHLIFVIPDFLAAHPHVAVDLQISNRFVDLVEEGYDLALRVGSLTHSRLVARRLAPSRRGLFASPIYLARAGLPRKAAALAAHACLVIEVGAPRSVGNCWVVAHARRSTCRARCDRTTRWRCARRVAGASESRCCRNLRSLQTCAAARSSGCCRGWRRRSRPFTPFTPLRASLR